MTDQELLMYAAKAAGLDYRPDDGEIRHGDAAMKWNPLENDGAALRLVTKLRLMLEVTDYLCVVIFECGGFLHVENLTLGNVDQNATVRRAIVRCAAAVGKVKK